MMLRGGAWLAPLLVVLLARGPARFDFCAATAVAQDVPNFENPYDLNKAKKAQVARPHVKVDLALKGALTTKLAQCYREEQGHEISAEDRALLTQFASDVVLDLATAFGSTSCKLDGQASSQCLQQIASLKCSELAKPIVEAGWDRNLPQEIKLLIADYAQALAAREGICKGYAADEATLVGHLTRDHLAALVEMQVVTGQCQLFPDKLDACKAQIQSSSCSNVFDLEDRGELSQLCTEMLPCSIKGIDSDLAKKKAE